MLIESVTARSFSVQQKLTNQDLMTRH